jgi:purine-binding chemotaxis protein CheW
MTVKTNNSGKELLSDRSQIVQVLTWSVDGKLFGMDVHDCREIVRGKKITNVPHAPETILGIVNLRGEVVTVLDLSRLLGYKSSGQNEKPVLIRLKSGNQQISIKADIVYDVIDAKESEFEPPPSNLTDLESRFITSVLLIDKGLAVILNSREIAIP